MDPSTLFSDSQFGHPTRYEEPVESPENVLLMDMIFEYLREDPSKSSLPTPVDSKIQTWAASLPDYQVSPIVTEIHEYTEHSDSSVHSSPSPRHSISMSDTSSVSDSGGPKTPPLASSIMDTTTRSIHNGELVFSTMPKLPTPATQVNLNRNCSLRRSSEVVRSPSRATSLSRRVSLGLPSNPSSPVVERASLPKMQATHPRMLATVTNLVTLPEFVPSPSKTPNNSKSSIPRQLRISTGSSAAPQLPSLVHPEFELSFPTTRPTFAERKVQSYMDQARQSAPVPDLAKELLRTLEARKISPKRLSMALPPSSSPNVRLESINRLKTSRQSMQIVIPTQVQKPIEEVPIYARDQRLAGMEYEFLRSLETVSVPLTRQSIQFPVSRPPTRNVPEVPVQNHMTKPVGVDQLTARMQRKLEIERVPIQPVKAILAPRAPTSSGIWSSKGFLSGREGMQIKMTRKVTNFAKAEWVIENDDGSKILKGFGHSNSLSRKTDFSDVDDTPIFTMQKKTGSTRVAEAPNGTSLFTIKNTLYSSPYWTVNIGSDTATAGTAQWTANGDASLETVTVSWGGFQVGRISIGSKAKKHTYIVDIAPEVNYCVMAALATVFDDLRTDEGC